MPEVEHWTFGALPVQGRVAFNFGAPGDRRHADGTLWWASPPKVAPGYVEHAPVLTVPDNPREFYHHSSRMQADHQLNWVAASGLIGIEKLRVPLAGIAPDKWLQVRLYFTEPEHTAAGKRVFGIRAGKRTVVADLDIFQQSGGQFRLLVQECCLPPPADGKHLELHFTAVSGEPIICGISLAESAPPPDP
jgi:hypothetical protein